MGNKYIKITRPNYLGWIAIIKTQPYISNGILCTVIDDLNTKSQKLQLFLYKDEYEIITDVKEIN